MTPFERKIVHDAVAAAACAASPRARSPRATSSSCRPDPLPPESAFHVERDAGDRRPGGRGAPAPGGRGGPCR